MKTLVKSVISAGVVAMGTMSSAYAASAGSMATNAADDLSSFWGLLMTLAGLGGLICVILGVVKFSRERHGSSDAGHGGRLFLVGVALLSLTALIGAVSGTFYGTDKTQTTINKLNGG